MSDDEKLSAAIRAFSEARWSDRHEPMLLSALSPLLEKDLPDFKTSLGTRTLKSFVKETGEVGGYKLIEHPTQRARVAVVPVAAEYEFRQEEPRAPRGETSGPKNQEATVAFLRALATLPSEDVDKVVIPVSILVKLLK